MTDTILKDTQNRMTKSFESIQKNFGSIRSGKATPSLLDGVRVDYHGTIMPLNQLASVSVPEPRLMVVQCWDKTAVGEVAKAIQVADLGLNPQVDANIIRLPIPALNEERRRELVKQCKKISEEGKVAIRNIRRDGNDALKKGEKDKDISEDDRKRAEEKVQELTDKFVAQIDELMDAKESEIMEV